MFAYRHVPYDNELWWQFAFHASAPRSSARLAARGHDRRGLRLVAPAAAGAAADFRAERGGSAARRAS